MRVARWSGKLSDFIDRCMEFILFLCCAVSAEICEAYEAIDAKTVAFIVIPMTTIMDARMCSPGPRHTMHKPQSCTRHSQKRQARVQHVRSVASMRALCELVGYSPPDDKPSIESPMTIIKLT